MLYLISGLILVFGNSQALGADTFNNVFHQLSLKTGSFKTLNDQARREIEALKKEEDRDIYISKEETVRALNLALAYPENPEFTQRCFEKIGEGLPPDLDQTQFLIDYFNMVHLNVFPYFAAVRRIIYSSSVYNFEISEREKLRKLLRTRSEKIFSSPQLLVDVVFQLQLIQEASKKGINPREDGVKIDLDKTEALLDEGQKISGKLSAQAQVVGTDPNGEFNIEALSPVQKTKTIEMITTEFKETALLRKKALELIAQRQR